MTTYTKSYLIKLITRLYNEEVIDRQVRIFQMCCIERAHLSEGITDKYPPKRCPICNVFYTAHLFCLKRRK